MDFPFSLSPKLTRFLCHSWTARFFCMHPTILNTFFSFFLLIQDNMFCSYLNLFCVAVSLLHLFSISRVWFVFSTLSRLCKIPPLSTQRSPSPFCHIFTPLLLLGAFCSFYFLSPHSVTFLYTSPFSMVICSFRGML